MPSVIGQDLTASGFDPGLTNPPTTFGVWGDSGTGTGVLGSSGSGIGVTAESTGSAALHARNPVPGGPVVEARLATPLRAAEFRGEVEVDGRLAVGIGAGTAAMTSLHLPLAGLQIGASGTRSDNFHWTSDVNAGPRALRLYNGDYGTGAMLLSVTAAGGVGAGTPAPLARMHIRDGGGFGPEDAGGVQLSSQVPLLTQSDSTTFGVLNADGRAVFALNIEGNEHTSDRRGVPTFYDRYDGNWHPSMSLRNGMVGIGTPMPDTPLTVAGGARFRGVVAGTSSPGVSYEFGYETVGVTDPAFNLRLQSPNSIMFHTGGNPPELRAVIDEKGRMGLMGRSPEPLHRGSEGGLRTVDVEAEGSIWCAKDVEARQCRSRGNDVAETFPAAGPLEAGDVVCVEGSGVTVGASRQARAATVVGVVSTGAGVLLTGPRPGPDRSVSVALCGRVPCKVSDENGPIRPGDLLTSASRPGHAMRADHETGRAAIIGKALTPLPAGTGLIEVLVATG